jgi:cytochrome c553
MNIRHIALSALVALGGFAPAHAQDMEAGQTLAAEVCAACHGANGVGVGDRFPNLAGQKVKYLDGQLKAFKADRRKNPMMEAVAEQLSADDIANLAAFFASLPGATPDTANSKPLDNLIAARMAFPADFDSGFTHYTTINFENRKQVRKYYANAAALAAARDGQPLPDGAVLLVEVFGAKLGDDGKPMVGADGFYVIDKLNAYTGMEKQSGWGDDIPELLRNGDWNYGLFGANKSARQGVNQATCLACHKPLADDSFVFTLEKLQEVARK